MVSREGITQLVEPCIVYIPCFNVIFHPFQKRNLLIEALWLGVMFENEKRAGDIFVYVKT